MNLLFLFLSIFVSFVSPSSSNTEGANGTTNTHHDDSNGVKKHKIGGDKDYLIGDMIIP